MPTNPTTKSQVQAYRFVLRRMESALVRKDAVMLHEPMRNHLRAAVVGVLLGMLALAAFYVVGLFRPTSRVELGDIVNIEGTTGIYVVVERPDEGNGPSQGLVPVLNLTSARLLVAAISPGESEPPETKTVEESDLKGFTRLPTIGLVGAPPTLPDKDNMADGEWSVCDTAVVRDDLPDAEARPELSTTVLVGTAVPDRPGRPLRPDQALLVEAETTGEQYLISNGRRLPITASADNRAVRLAYQLSDAVPRKVSVSLLNAIPEGDALTPPDIPRLGTPFERLPGIKVGDVVRADFAERHRFFLVLAQGTQEVSPAVADLIRTANRGTGVEFPKVTPETIGKVPPAPAADRLDFSDFPDRAPVLLGIRQTPIVCLVWPGPDADPVVTVSTEHRLPMGEGVAVPGVVRGQADRVFVEPGKGALVRSVVPDQRTDTGPIWLVTDQGLRYGVPSIGVARALGLGEDTRPAPEPILGLLKIGPVLDPQQALERYDPELAREQEDGG